MRCDADPGELAGDLFASRLSSDATYADDRIVLSRSDGPHAIMVPE